MTSLINPDEAPRALVVVAEKYSAYQGEWHSHRRAQLVHASQGVIHVQTTEGRWVVPPQRAVWILPDVLHQVSSRQGFWL
ncbi:MAG TPA: AraC family ligand binding domain-containing protein, partial [Alphaproteobacteria bacterium]|nr:AraC family ligand binding domain-containing protein [Alphaproteobacteria bacterium]